MVDRDRVARTWLASEMHGYAGYSLLTSIEGDARNHQSWSAEDRLRLLSYFENTYVSIEQMLKVCLLVEVGSHRFNHGLHGLFSDLSGDAKDAIVSELNSIIKERDRPYDLGDISTEDLIGALEKFGPIYESVKYLGVPKKGKLACKSEPMSRKQYAIFDYLQPALVKVCRPRLDILGIPSLEECVKDHLVVFPKSSAVAAERKNKNKAKRDRKRRRR